MGLQTYREKRDFRTTPEPRGRKARKSSERGSRFVIQKHAARRLHYDLRLEMNGVLKSWAVTRGPSLVPGEKRLAVEVEDHPLEYGGFEGTIPKGEYGGGSVIVWDRGTWTPVADPERGLKKGHLEFALDGEKLSGRWHLVRMARRRGEKRNNWLLIKADDEEARAEGDDDILDERPESVKTGRVVEELEGEAPGWSSRTGRIPKAKAKPATKRTKTKAAKTKTAGTATKAKPTARKAGDRAASKAKQAEAIPDPSTIKGAKKAKLPGFIPPVLATLQTKAPAGKDWIHEIKFDGYRLQAHIEAGRVKLFTRSGLDWTAKFGKAIRTALAALPAGTALIDGELVVEGDNGASDFSVLQSELSEGRSDRFVFYAFDLLHLDGYDLTGASLIDRKRVLQALLSGSGDPLRYSDHFAEDGGLVLQHACRLSLEGIISKRADAPYRSGRGKSWIKSKCSARQEFVIGGYVPSTTSRRTIGSLVLGVYESDKLRHVGRVGTGFTAKIAQDLWRRLEKRRSDESPFAQALPAAAARQVRYVRPDLVAEVEFRGWTADRNLRHAAFRGLREDKPAKDVVPEMPIKPTKTPQRRTVRLSHPDRIYWPDAGVTKEGLADYYAEAWRSMAPYLVNRPLALLRCPQGVSGECFFQKNAGKGMAKTITTTPDPKAEGGAPLIAVHDLDGLLSLVQVGTLEIHPWGSTLDDWERPDTIIMDLDPGDGVAWTDVIAAAHDVRERLAQYSLTSFVKTSGGKGLHVVAPIRPKAQWPAVKAFTKSIADAMAKDSPDKYVATITKSKRKGKILIDSLRNQRGATAIAPYSTRARAGAPVAMPLTWEELSADIGPAHFNVGNAPTRIAAVPDPWSGFRKAAAPIETKASSRKRAA